MVDNEQGNTSERAPAAGWLAQLLAWMRCYIPQNLTFGRSNVRSPPPVSPPPPESENAVILDIQDIHPPPSISPPTPSALLLSGPGTVAMRENELGKLALGLAVTSAVALLVFHNDGNAKKLRWVPWVLVGLMAGCAFIWNGILFRTSYLRLASCAEQVGVSLVFVSLFGLVASSLPKAFSSFLWICGGLFLLPFTIPLLSYVKQLCKQLVEFMNG